MASKIEAINASGPKIKLGKRTGANDLVAGIISNPYFNHYHSSLGTEIL